MKDALILLVALIALGLSTFTLFQSKQGDDAMASSNAPGVHSEEHHEHADIEVAYTMAHIQRHFNKLYFAGTNSNWPLASFYVHELEEAMEEIADAGIVEDGVNLSELMKVMGLMPLEGLEDAVKAEDKEAFLLAYDTQIASCNSCHINAKHPYIKIKQPESPFMDNQIFTAE